MPGLLLFLSLFVTSRAWLLQSNYDEVEPGKSKNVHLACLYDPNLETKHDLREVIRIRLERMSVQGNFEDFASIKLGGQTTQTISDIKLDGKIVRSPNHEQSFLNVTWPVATDFTVGTFNCKVDGYTYSDNAVNLQSQSPLTILEDKLTPEELLKIIEDAQRENKKLQAGLENEIQDLKDRVAEEKKAAARLHQSVRDFLNQTINNVENGTEKAHSNLRKYIREQISILGDKFEFMLQQNISELKTFMANETAKEVMKIQDFVKDVAANLMKQNNETREKLEAEILDRQEADRMAEEKLQRELTALRNATLQEISNQTESLDAKLTAEIVKNKLQNENEHKRLQDQILKAMTESQDEDEKLEQKIRQLENETSDQILRQKQAIEEKHDQDILNITKEYKEAIVSLEEKFTEELNVTETKLLTKCQEMANDLQLQISTLMNQSREEHDALKELIWTTRNLTLEEIRQQTENIVENFNKDLSQIRNESFKNFTDLLNQISELRNFTVNEISEQSKEDQMKFKEELQELKNYTTEEINSLINKVYEYINGQILDLSKEQNETNINLEKEIADRKLQGSEADAKLRKQISDLTDFIIRELFNQSEEFEKKLKQGISYLNQQVQTTLAKHDKDINETRQLRQDADEELERKLDQLMRYTNESITELNIHLNESVEESILIMKNYSNTNIESAIRAVNKTIDQEIAQVRNDIKLEIENETQAVENILKNEISVLRNFTVEHIEEEKDRFDNHTEEYKRLKNSLETEYVTKNDLSYQLSLVKNFTIMELEQQEDALLALKNFTTNEMALTNKRASEEYVKIYDKIRDVKKNCSDLYTELRSNFTHPNTDVLNTIEALDKNHTSAILAVRKELNSLSRVVDSIDGKYGNITDSLWKNLTQKSFCTCPTLEPPNSTITTEPTTTMTTTTESTTPKISQWPEGTYALILPDSGCPESEEFTWEEGWIRFHTETDYNADSVSSGNHFRKPIFLTDGIDNFMELHYCLKTMDVPNARPWPKGSYCVNRLDGACPSDFRSVYIQYDGEHTHIQHLHDNSPDVTNPQGSIVRVHYCCRKDGPHTTEIYLPYTKPFYLYKETDFPCQKVWGTRVVEESFQVDTEHNDNEDKFEHPDTHPAAFLNPVNHTMCYYVPI